MNAQFRTQNENIAALKTNTVTNTNRPFSGLKSSKNTKSSDSLSMHAGLGGGKGNLGTKLRSSSPPPPTSVNTMATQRTLGQIKSMSGENLANISRVCILLYTHVVLQHLLKHCSLGFIRLGRKNSLCWNT